MAWYVGRVPGESDACYNAAVKNANATLAIFGGFIVLIVAVGATLAYFAH